MLYFSIFWREQGDNSSSIVIAHIHCCGAEVRGPAAGYEQHKANTQIRKAHLKGNVNNTR